MHYLDLSLPGPEQNLACDEALLDECDAGRGPEVLRFWEPDATFVVVGYANLVAHEVNQAACLSAGVPVLRRISGGGTVLQAAGCLNYALVLQTERQAALATIAQTNRFILDRHRAALTPLLGERVSHQGDTDLALDGRKFSGNAQRRGRRAVLFHGTFLLHLDLGLVERYLHLPSRQPIYRDGRAHQDFLTNLRLDPGLIKQALKAAWHADDAPVDVPHARIAELVQGQYCRREWNQKLLTTQKTR